MNNFICSNFSSFLQTVMLSFITSVAISLSLVTKLVVGWPFFYHSGGHVLMHIMIFLTSPLSVLILAVPRWTCLVLVFFTFLSIFSHRATTWWCIYALLSIAPGFCVCFDSPPMTLHNLLIVISVIWSKGNLQCGLAGRELLKPPCYRYLHAPTFSSFNARIWTW